MTEKNLLLKAEHCNWGLIGPGAWHSTVWQIYSDRSYEKKTYYIPEPEERDRILANRENKPIKDLLDLARCISRKGKIHEKRFANLLTELSADPWRDPDINSAACDGDAWIIEEYDSEQNVIKSSGPLYYIYGQPVLEAIVKLLP